MTPAVESRLPQVGTTIFTVMSALAQEHGAVNLGQGFPDFDCDPRLLDAVDAAMRGGLNQYPPMAGVPALRERVAGEDRGALRPPLRPGERDHRHRRRDAGDPHRDPGAGAPRRRSDRARPLLRQLRPEHRARRRDAGARAADARHASRPTSSASPPRSRRARARSSSTRRTTRAPPCWSKDDMERLAALLRPTDVLRHQRRGLRAHGVRRASTRASRAFPSWRRAASSSRASARPTTSPAGRSATPPRRRR